MQVLTTNYQPPSGLPMMNLTIKDGKLQVLDWSNDKTAKIFAKFNQYATFVSADKLGRPANEKVAKQVINQLDEYFASERQVFDIPLDLSTGTPFQIKVWQALLQIPYGQTISYATLAKNIGKPTAFRACANANGKNPISLIVPCHRVIASDGSLGGYTGGIDIKKTLLALEGCL